MKPEVSLQSPNTTSLKPLTGSERPLQSRQHTTKAYLEPLNISPDPHILFFSVYFIINLRITPNLSFYIFPLEFPTTGWLNFLFISSVRHALLISHY